MAALNNFGLISNTFQGKAYCGDRKDITEVN